MLSTVPILYSFRRCPYAIRARMALQQAGIAVELREVVLKDKPACMVGLSPKATVPVLLLKEGGNQRVIDESLAVMLWALQQQDPNHLLGEQQGLVDASVAWIEKNDGEFKFYLDRYKYADRYPEHNAEHYRSQAMVFIQQLQDVLQGSSFLLGPQASLADVAVFPFVRQFAFVDKPWFDQTVSPALQAWLDYFLQSTAFATVMKKYPQWQVGDAPTLL